MALWWYILTFSFVYYYYKSSDIDNIYKICWINVSGLKPTNKRFSDKEEYLFRAFSRRSMILLNDRPGMMSINTSQ